MQNKHKFIDLWPIKAQVSVLLYLSKFARWAEKRIAHKILKLYFDLPDLAGLSVLLYILLECMPVSQKWS